MDMLVARKLDELSSEIDARQSKRSAGRGDDQPLPDRETRRRERGRRRGPAAGGDTR